MKKVPDVGVVRKRGRPPKKKLAVEAPTPLAAGEGTQLAVTGALELDVPVVQTSTDTSSSGKRQLSSGLKSRNGSKLASLGPVKITKRKRRPNASVETSLDVKRPASSGRSSKYKVKTLLSKAVKRKAQQVSQHVKSSTLHILSRGKSKSRLHMSQKKKSKLQKFCRSKISRMKSMKAKANELKDSVTTEMKRLLTTDGFWSTKASSSPHSQPDDSLVQGHGSTGKKDSRTSTPDVTPSGTRRHSLSKTVTDKDDTTVQRANISGSELRRLRTADRFSFRDANVSSRTSSRDISPCSSSSLDRGTRLNSRSFTRGNENKNGMAIDDADTLAVADNVVSARNKMTVKKESCSSKDKLSEDQKEMSSTLSPLTTDADEVISSESPVSRFKKKHFLDKAANITKHKRLSANIESKKKLSLMQRTSRRQRLKSILITSQSTAGESSIDPNLSTSTNVPKLKKNRQLSRQSVDKSITEKTPERRRKVKQKQRNISDLGTSVPHAVLEDALENSCEPAAGNISLENSVSSTKPCVSPEFLIADLIDSAELKRLNTTAGFWSSASGIDTFLGIDQPRKLRDADGNSIKEAGDCIKPKPIRQRKLHLGKFPKTAVTPTSTLLQHRKKKLHSLQSKLVKTKQSAPSNDLAEQQQSTMVGISPESTEASSGRKSRPRARLFGVRKHRRKRSITLDEDSKDRSMQGVQTISESMNVVHSEANAETTELAALLIDASGSKYEKEKCVEEERAVNSSERDTKHLNVTSDYLIAKHNSDILENYQGIKTVEEPVYLEMYSQTSPEMPDVEMDTSANDTPTAHEPLLKTYKRGRRDVLPGEVHATPSSKIRTRGRGKGGNTVNSSLEVVKNLEPSNRDTRLSSSPAISKVASERQKIKKVKKESLAKLDLSELNSGDEISSHHAEVDEIKNSQVKDNEKDNLSDPKVHKSRGKVGNTVDIPIKVLNRVGPCIEDALLPSASAISKVVSERRKVKKVKKESLAKLDLSELKSGDEISSHHAEVDEIKNSQVKDNEKDNLSDPKVHKSRGKVGNTVDIPIKVLNRVGPCIEDALLPSASAISKVVSERRKVKKVKKESLAKLDLSELKSGDETDKMSSHHAEVAEIKNTEVKDNEKDNLSDPKVHKSRGKVGNTVDIPIKVLNRVEPSIEDALLPSASAISEVVSERRKVQKKSLAKLDLSELNSGARIDTISSLDVEIADIKNSQLKDNEVNSSDPKTSPTEVDIGKHVHVGKQNSLHTKSNLFESLGYSLNMPSETSAMSCLNSLVCDVKDSCSLHENVAESLFKTHTLSETENVCDMKWNDVLYVAQTESSAINLSNSTMMINPQELKDAKLRVTGDGKELMNDTLEELGAGCLDVCHKDTFADTSGSLQDLPSDFSSEYVISSEPAVQGSVETEALNSTSVIEQNVCEGHDYALPVVVPASEVKADILKSDHVSSVLPGLVESEASISLESTTASVAELKCNSSEKQFIDEESKVVSENELSSVSGGSKTEQQVEQMKLAEPGVEADAFLPQEDSAAVNATSAGIGLIEQFQDYFTEPHLFSESERKADNVSMENVGLDSTEQCQMLKSGSSAATDDIAEKISCNVKSGSIEVDKSVNSVISDSELEIAEPESCEDTNVKSQKRKRKQTTESVRCKIRKHLVETTDTSASLETISLDLSAVPPVAAFDFSSWEKVSEGEQNEGPQEANMVQAPVKKARKRRRNAWQRGVLKANMSHKAKKSVKKSIIPEQSDMSTSVLDSNDEQIDRSISMLVSDEEQIDKSAAMLVSDEKQIDKSASVLVSNEEQIDKSASVLVFNDEQIDKSASVLSSNDEQIDKSASVLASNEEQIDKSASVLASNEEQIDKSASVLASNEEQIDKSASVLASNEEQIDKSASVLASNEEQIDKSASVLASNEEQIDKSASVLASNEEQIDKSASVLVSNEEQIDKSASVLASNEEQIDKSAPVLASNEQIDKSTSALALNDEQSDMSTLLSVSTHDKVCVPDDIDNLDAVTSALISRVMAENQMSGCLNENDVICPALHSNCDDVSQVSDGMPSSESTSAVLISDSSTKIPYLDDSKIPCSDDSRVPVSDSNFHIADDSKTSVSDDSRVPVSDTCKISVADDGKIQLSVDSKIPVSDDYQKRDMLVPSFSSSCDTTAQLSENVMSEIGHQVTDTYTPAVTKSLKNMLKKLQTNANLAHADFGVGSYKGKFLRNIQQKEQKQKRLNARRKLLSADQEVTGDSERIVVYSTEPQIGVSEMPVRRKRGRPKKQTGESFPKLTPVGLLPLLRSVTPWNKTPPDLSPHDLTAPQFVDVNIMSTQEADIVPESVDDTDLHLYLSGVSDEEKSPKKELGPAWLASFHTDSSVYQEQKDSSISVYEDIKAKSSVQDTATDMLFGAESFTTQKSIVIGGKEPKKRGRPKKGSRGRPPGIPMTDEERLKRKDEEKLKRRKALKVFNEECEDQNFLNFLRTSQRSVDTSDFFTTPSFSGSIPAGNFSLRKKSTRSPLEMLAIKRKQEEAIYDLEQEKRQARLIHLREKRSARESGEGFSDDEVGEDSSENIMTCSVVLNDFVKKLQLDEFEFSSGEEGTHEAPDNTRHSRGSPDYNPSEDRDEDWRADFEEHDSEEWNNNRPSIPRLKLKRIIKKGTQSQIKSTKLTMQTPKERQHVPIKLVIKSEPAGELNEQAGLRLSADIESSKVERSGFENSFMDFLKKKSHPIAGKSDASERSYNVSRPGQLQEGMQNVAADLSGVEILSLPTLGVRGALAVDTNAFITRVQSPSAARFLSGSSTSIGDRASALAQSRVDANACPLDKLSNLEHAGRAKPMVSVDDDEDDILILDLEDGTVEQNSNDLSHFSASASSEVLQTSGIASATNQESTSEKRNSHTGSALLNHLQRSYSNDEMGLMFESYNSQKDPDKLNQLCVAQNAGDSFVSIGGHFEDLSGNKETRFQTDVAQPLACVVKDTAVKTAVSSLRSQTSQSEVQKPHAICLSTGALTLSAEPSRTGTKEVDGSDSAVVSDDITNTEALFNTCHTDGDILTYSKKQSDGEGIPKVNRAVDSIITNSVINANISDGQKEGGVLDSEVLATTPDKADEYVPGDASTDNNNVTSLCTSSLKTGSFKKPCMAGDNNKSPKHSTYHGSVPEDWRVKVILHSDKFPSGKYSCKRCSFSAPAKLTIESHIYSHIPGVQFRCAYCESEFSSMAATSSHLKNTHSLSEAKLHISRHIDEKNFYDKETAVFSEESRQQSPVHPTSAGTNAGGQSPPVIISVVVSSRGGRSSAPAHRFVCTHCGFSTNVKEDAEHHVLDLHSSQALFACLLCSENVCYTESEIKDHCAIVHPARKHPYKKLPDFYDAELLSLKEKSASQDDRENIFERMSSLFQDETQPGITTVDHKQKAKEYLYLQEGWREKTKVEADSTTAVDYTDEHDDAEGPSAPLTSAELESLTENVHLTTSGENEVFADHHSNSQVPGVSEGDMSETTALLHDDFITSSAGTASNVNNSHVDSEACSERHDQHAVQEESFSSQPEELPIHVVRETTEDENIQQGCYMDPDHGVEDDDDGGGMGLKIVQVVSLSEQSEDLIGEQMGAEHVHTDTDGSAGNIQICQVGAVISENSSTSSKVLELSPSEHSSAPVDNVTLIENSVPCSLEKEAATSGTVAGTESTAADSSATDNSSASSPIASPSFANGLPLSYKCNACKVHTPYLLMMVKHLKAKHPNMRCFSCPYCKTAQSFVSQKQLRHHVKQSHPNKFGRNEIALSEDAKKFVEAMVLPIGPECIRVGNRIVLEEDIHTCTYCKVKMVSLTSVYEHLNTKHSDLFEFVCPVCQDFRSKLLPDIFEHCLKTHKSSLDTDKVHVSVPKNLFTALTCISRSGKYIEKTLAIGSPGKMIAASSSSTSLQPEKAHIASVPQRIPQLPPTGQISSSEQHPLSETSSAAPPIPSLETMPNAQVIAPLFAVPFTSSVGAGAAAGRPVVAFSSSLFDTSSLTSHQLAVASHSIPFVQNAAAASFLSPLPQQAHSNPQHVQSGKQSHSKSSERTHGSAKTLPVLNVPTIRPRTSPVATKPVVGNPIDAMQLSASNSNLYVMSASGAAQQSFRSTSSSSIIDNLPDDEPNPDAFKIFNLCPTVPRMSPSTAPSLTPGVPTVFPPVSAPMAAGYIQGQIAGFPPGMVISPNLLPLSFPYSQHQSVMQGLLAQKHSPQTSPLPRHPHLSHSSSALMAAQSARRNSMASEEAAATAYLKKKQQQREFYLKKQQQQQQLESHRHQYFRQSQQQTVPRAHPAHQQPPSLSGQVYQPQPRPLQSHSYDHQQALPGPNDPLHASLFSSSVAVTSTAGPSGHLMSHSSPSPGRPSKGLHKRSNTLYQCPYCPVMVTLKVLEVASHIQQHHPGKQVTFRKIV